MTDKEKQIQLSRYRLKQAAESIDEAVYLLWVKILGGKMERVLKVHIEKLPEL